MKTHLIRPSTSRGRWSRLRIRVAVLLASVAGFSTLAQDFAAGAESKLSVPAVVAGYLPALDTNVGIGISYPPGSPEFVYLVAGIRPPGGDPRLPPVIEPASTNLVIAVAGPTITYETAPRGATFVMTRVVSTDVIYDYPPGAFLRGSTTAPAATAAPAASDRARSGLIPYPERTTTATGEDFVQTFPPGARIIGHAPLAPK